jgi:hypothetical protein
MLAPLYRKYGCRAVWKAAFDSLGYPPTWLIDAKQLAILTEALLKGTTNGRCI